MLIVIRGLPGSGKSTVGQKLAEAFSCAFVEPDMFCRNNLRYHYTPMEYELSVKKAQDAVALLQGCDLIYADVLPLAADVDRVAECHGEKKPDLVINLVCSQEYSRAYNRHHVAEKDIDRFCKTWEDYKCDKDVTARAECTENMIMEVFKWAIERAQKADMERWKADGAG